jgi:hypothetical protein
MGNARKEQRSCGRSKSKHKSQQSSKRSEEWRPKIMNGNKSVEEETDRLLLSSLKYWEVERDLIEERLAARCR